MNKLLRTYIKLPSYLLALVFFVGGCTTPVTPDFSSMSEKYANILEQYQINSILMNIIRASNDRPLSFLDIPNITGSGNVTTSPTIGGVFNGFVGGLAGGALGSTSINPSISLSFGNSFNFSQSSLDNATFLQGFLSPISVQTARFFISDNIPREVMFSLVLSSIEIRSPSGTSRKYINNPLLPEYPLFQKELYKLLSYGLTVEQFPISNEKLDTSVPLPPGINRGEIKINPVVQNAGGTPFDGSPYLMNSYAPQRPQYQYKVCVDQNKFSNFVKEEFSSDIFCRSNQVPAKNKEKKYELILQVRSSSNIFEYLGQVVAAQNMPHPYLVVLPPSEGVPERKVGELNQYALLIVNKNSVNEKSFASVTSLDGDLYTVPSMNNGYSTLVIKIISQLLSLNKIPGAIPSSPGILLR